MGAGFGLLDQLYLSGNAGHPGIAGAFHGRPPDRLSEHVIAKGPLVAPVKRLKVNDGGIFLALKVRANGILGKTLTADLLDVLRYLAGWNPQRIADSLYSRKPFADAEVINVVVKTLAV